MAIVPEACMKMALGENPKRVYGGRNQTPVTRMATAALIREQLEKARRYRAKVKEYEQGVKEGRTDVKEPEFNQKLHSLMRVFDGMPVKIHAHRADDIMTAIRIMEEFGLKGTIDHCTEGYLIPEALKKHNASCILGPTLCNKSKPEVQNKEFESAKILNDYGIPFAIMTDHPVVELQNTLLQLGRFVRAGLPVLEALKAVTISSAKLSYVDHLVGSIEVGKDADIVIWSHNPFHHLATPKLVLIDGQIVHKK
jgi:imidazolonepropionase-like amidohydrolase